jgi:hypothetical protein
MLDNHGGKELAVVGEDLGDAHYRYQNVEGFQHCGTIDVRTRKEVISWLEMIIKESQLEARGAIQDEVEHLGEQTPNNPEGLYYVKHECALKPHARSEALCTAAVQTPCLIRPGLHVGDALVCFAVMKIVECLCGLHVSCARPATTGGTATRAGSGETICLTAVG